MSTSFFYRGFGLTLQSDRELPRLLPGQPANNPDITLSFSALSPLLDTYPHRLTLELGPGMPTPAPPPNHWKRDYCYQLRYWNGIAAAITADGSRLLIECQDEDIEEAIALLLGPVLGLCARLQGKLCLHASVLANGHGAFALMAPSGGGKSTTAAALAQLGLSVMSDDLLILDITDANTMLAEPGYPDLRLTPEAGRDVLGESELPSVAPSSRKGLVELARHQLKYCSRPMPLLALYTGAPQGSATDAVDIQPMADRDALLTLITHTFPSRSYPLPTWLREQETAKLARLLEQVPVHRIHYRRHLSSLPVLCAHLIHHSANLQQQTPDSFADFLPLALDSLNDALVSKASRNRLWQSARHMPATERTLFEFRLESDSEQIDVSQNFRLADTTLLRQLADRNPASTAHSRLQELIKSWVMEGRYPNVIQDIWLEQDNDKQSHGIPSLFLHLTSVTAGKQQRGIQDVISQLLPSPKPFLDALQRCIKALPMPLAPNYLGVMLSRRPLTLRVNFSQLTADETLLMLQRINWPGHYETLQRALDIASASKLRTVLCVDLSPQPSARIGIELFPVDEAADWSEILEKFSQLGLSARGKVEGIVSWIGRTTPEHYPDWPDRLIAESLQRSNQQFSLFDRQLNHLKLVCTADGELSAKAYLSFNHHWAESDDVAAKK